MLQKIINVYTEEHEILNLEDEKIYWDTKKNQFRHKFNCCECQKPLECMCYNELWGAVGSVNDGFICDECGIKYALDETEVDDLIYMLAESRRLQVEDFIKSLVTEQEIKEYIEDTEIEEIERFELIEIIDENNDKATALKNFVISLMTEEEKRDNWIEACDYDGSGSPCEL